MKTIASIFLLFTCVFSFAQTPLTPERLWELGRLGAVGISTDGTSVVYRVTHYSISENNSSGKYYSVPVQGGTAREIEDPASLVSDHNLSPDGKFLISVKDVKIRKVFGNDYYPELEKSNAQIYDNLNYRHWDTWEDGAFSHVFVSAPDGSNSKDIMKDEPYDCPQKPFGGEEDYVWNPDSKSILYVTKKKYGKDYAVSTNTDIYSYDVTTGKTTNITEGMNGYDTNPSFSSKGVLAWLSMKRDGYESDKNDIVVRTDMAVVNLTQSWDGTVSGFTWSNDGAKIYFNAAVDGTIQLFEIPFPSMDKKMPAIKQITKGEFDITGIVGQTGNQMVVSRTDMNHATELYTVNLADGSMKQLTHVNDEVYQVTKLSKIERRYMTTTDKKKMLSWIIYPPDFDPAKKYPTLLYCQGGPQSPLSQFYSFRWNFQLMAANGYIIVAPNRRGMPGHGVEWNEEISKDHGGQVMDDYLTAIDEFSKEKFVDKNRLGCIGASYGGYSVFYLAGIHNNRFKTFISHDGIFDMQSMYGTTEELFFPDWDWGGPYWETKNKAAQKTYEKFNPINMVDKWNTPILIIQGGRDYRVPIGQGLEAFQAAQLKGIKSKLLLFPEENHWVLHTQNGIVWQREFFKWLKETL